VGSRGPAGSHDDFGTAVDRRGTHREVFGWVRGVVAIVGWWRGSGSPSMKPHWRRTRRCVRSCDGNGESTRSFCGIGDGTRGLRHRRGKTWMRCIGKRKKRSSTQRVEEPADEMQRIAKMQAGRTHLAQRQSTRSTWTGRGGGGDAKERRGDTNDGDGTLGECGAGGSRGQVKAK